jgi:hypothetical protein
MLVLFSAPIAAAPVQVWARPHSITVQIKHAMTGFMNMPALLRATLVAGFCALALVVPANAAPRERGDAGLWMQVQARAQLSLRQVVEIIDAQEPGRMLDSESVVTNGRLTYVVRWEPSREALRGRILFFTVDAETGQILSRRGG